MAQVRRQKQQQPAVTEADLREQIRTLAHLYGWLMYFTQDSRRSPAGFPDLVLAHPEQGRIIYAELKSEKGRVTTHQAEWIEALKSCGQAVYLWRPDDITEIARLLGLRANSKHKQEDK